MAGTGEEALLGLYEETRHDLEKIFEALDELEKRRDHCDPKTLRDVYHDNAKRAENHLDFITKLIELETRLSQSQGAVAQGNPGRDTPIHFIVPNADKQLEVNPEALRVLEGVTGPLVVITVAGLFRTGKSFILNRLARQQRGFMLGPNVHSCTKGVWLWCPEVSVRRHGVNAHVVLLDTEGLGDSEKGDKKYDTAIFALAILLSSYFIYNNMRTINDDALQAVHLVGELASRVQVKSGQEGGGEEEERHKEFPAFCWLVRDSELALPGGQTPAQHLEDLLKLKRGAGEKIAQYNAPRSFIKQMFQSRDCILLRRPVEEEELLRRVDHLTTNQLHPEFVRQSEQFVQHVLDTAPIKQVMGRQITGPDFGGLATAYTTAINRGAIPVITDAFHSLVEIQGNRAVTLATEIYDESIQQLIRQQGGLPMPDKDLADAHEQCLREATDVISVSCLQDLPKYMQSLNANVREKYEQFDAQNESAARAVCEACLNELYEPIKCKMQDMTYINDPDQYTEDIQVLMACYSGRVSRSPSTISISILETFRENVLDEDIKKLLAFTAVDNERKAAIANEKRATDEAQRKAKESQEKTRRAAAEIRKMQEEQKRQNEAAQKRQKTERDEAARRNQESLRQQEERIRGETSRRLADMSDRMRNELREEERQRSSDASREQRNINELSALLNRLGQQRNNLHNQKY